MSAAAHSQLTARERIFETVIDQLVLLYAQIYDGDTDMAHQAALDAMDPYLNDQAADLAVAGQIVACGIASMRVFQMCMKPDATSADMARLCRTADTLSRTEQRHRTTGLYPTPPKPAPNRTATVHSLPTKAPPPVVDDAMLRKAQDAIIYTIAELKAMQPKQAPETGRTAVSEDYSDIFQAAREANREAHMDAHLGEVAADGAAPADDRTLIDRIRAASFPGRSLVPPRT